MFPQRLINNAQFVDSLGDIRVLRPKRLFLNGQRPRVNGQGVAVLALMCVRLGKPVQNECEAEVLDSKNFLRS